MVLLIRVLRFFRVVVFNPLWLVVCCQVAVVFDASFFGEALGHAAFNRIREMRKGLNTFSERPMA